MLTRPDLSAFGVRRLVAAWVLGVELVSRTLQTLFKRSESGDKSPHQILKSPHFRIQKVAIKLRVPLDHLLDGELREHSLPAGGPQPIAQGAVV